MWHIYTCLKVFAFEGSEWKIALFSHCYPPRVVWNSRPGATRGQSWSLIWTSLVEATNWNHTGNRWAKAAAKSWATENTRREKTRGSHMLVLGNNGRNNILVKEDNGMTLLVWQQNRTSLENYWSWSEKRHHQRWKHANQDSENMGFAFILSFT